jgi:hypothetical protein
MCVWNRLETEHDECAARRCDPIAAGSGAVGRWGPRTRHAGRAGAAAGVGGPLLAIEKLRREARPCYFSLTP